MNLSSPDTAQEDEGTRITGLWVNRSSHWSGLTLSTFPMEKQVRHLTVDVGGVGSNPQWVMFINNFVFL